MRKRLVALAIVTLMMGFAHAEHPATLITNVRVFDGENLIGPISVGFANGKITAVSKEIDSKKFEQTIDGTGKTLMPGMIDCHTHVWFETQLQQAAIFGVTTELDMMSMPTAAANLRRQQSDGKANHRADFYSAGAAVTVKKGHGTQFGFPVPTLDDAKDADTFVNERVREGSDYIKLILEDGSPHGMSLPTLTTEMFAAAVVAAHDRKKLAVSHISTADGARTAFENNIDGLVHLFAEQEVSDDLVKLAKTKGVFIVPTASVVAGTTGENLTAMILDDKQIESRLNGENLAGLARRFPKRPGQKGSWAILKKNIAKFHAGGIPILAGTDAPNPGTVHGASMHQELRMLVEAGLSAKQALAAATSIPADSFKLADRGRIAKGMRADLVLIHGDPTQDIAKVAHIDHVWKAGHAIDRKARLEEVAAERKAREMTSKKPAGKSRMISDFEDSKRPTKPTSSMGAGWAASTDVLMGGDSTVKMKIVADGANKSKSSLQIAGKTREQQPAFSGVMFSPGAAAMQPADLSSHKQISFWAKGNNTDCQVMLFYQKRGFQPSMKNFVASKEWKRFDYRISEFDGCDGTDVIGIWFGRGMPGEFKFQIDEVQLK